MEGKSRTKCLKLTNPIHAEVLPNNDGLTIFLWDPRGWKAVTQSDEK